MRRLNCIIALILGIGSQITAYAVTDKEMEEARVIATKTYLRYANNGSGYLDDLHPKTMSELEKNLKAKEKENIKAFKAIPVPTGYASWTKQQLVEYWGGTAFSNSGLLEKGKEGKSRTRKLIGAMAVSAPATNSPAAAPANQATPAPAAKTPDAAPSPAGAPKDATVSANDEKQSPTVAADSMASEIDEAGLLAEKALSAEEDDLQIKKADNHTWIYVVILAILVAIVIALVVFASSVMKKSAAGQSQGDNRPLPSPQPAKDDVAEQEERANEAFAQREKFAAVLAAKNNEIASLTKKLDEAQRLNATLKINLENVTKELTTLRLRLNAKPAAAPAATPAQASENTQGAHPAPSHLRTIYLGRANAKKIFVRADRTLNVGNSYFKLETTDGVVGSFRVVNDPTVCELALMQPVEILGEACTAPDLTATQGMTKIVTDSAGTALLEEGRWTVTRKAKIHYE